MESESFKEKAIDMSCAVGCYALADVLPVDGEDNLSSDASANFDLFNVDCGSTNELSLIEADCVPEISMDCECDTTKHPPGTGILETISEETGEKPDSMCECAC